MRNYLLKLSLGLVCSAFMSGGVENSYASAEDHFREVQVSPTRPCSRAVNQNKAVQSGERCTLSVYYKDYDLQDKKALKGVTYWVERRKQPNGMWSRFKTSHIFDRNGVKEYLSFAVKETYEYRVSVDIIGQKSFPELQTGIFPIYVKE